MTDVQLVVGLLCIAALIGLAAIVASFGPALRRNERDDH